MNYALFGHGRMGRAIDRVASDRGHHRAAAYDGPLSGEAAVAELLRESTALPEVAFEFTHGDVAEDNVVALLGRGIHVVCGTTGWDESPALGRALQTSEAALIVAANFSIGMNLFFRAVRDVAELIAANAQHQAYVLEAHHRGKRDVPSGTARRLERILIDSDPRLKRVREGNAEGVLEDDVLQVSSIRAGAEPGMHEVGFDGPYDVITMRHASRGREAFALGTVVAAEWLRGRRGRRSLDEVLDSRKGQRGEEERE